MYPFSKLSKAIKKLILMFPSRDLYFVLLIYILVLSGLIFFERATVWLDYLFIDLRAQIYAASVYSAPSQDIVVLAIDAPTLAQAPYSWPWPNHFWSDIINKITDDSEQQALLIDVYFQDKKDAVLDPIEPLAEAIKNNKKTGLVAVLDEMVFAEGLQMKLSLPQKQIRNNAAFWGVTHQKIDKDGKIRTFLAFDKRVDVSHLALALNAFLKPRIPKFDDLHAVDRLNSLFFIRKPQHGFEKISLIDFINNKIDKGYLSEKIVVIGATAPILHDYHDTSLGVMPGVDIVCNVVETVLNDKMQLFLPSFFSRFLYCCLGLFLALFIISDFIAKPVLVGLIAAFVLPAVFWGFSFFTNFFPFVGITYIVFVIFLITFYVVGRLMKISEIQQSLHEAQICGKIQQAFFPCEPFKNAKGLTCQGKCVPYQNAGGDYFDYFELANGNVFFILGDVAGHGISASMITTAVKSLVSVTSLSDELSMMDLILKVNTAIIKLTKKRLMMSGTMGLVNYSANKVQLLSAGHLPSLLLDKEGLKEYAWPGLPLGITPKFKLPKLLEFDIPKEATLLLHSDGIVEAVDWQNNLLGFDRFYDFFRFLELDLTCDEVIESVFTMLKAYVNGRAYEDDVTVLVLRFKKN